MSYAYKKQITITGQSGAGTDYQVPLLIGETSGASGENFDLGGYSLDFPSAKGDGGDLKFYADDETTVLPFWVESVTGSTPNRLATVWVKVSANLGSNQNIYVYFGDASAPNLSDGASTFIMFDDFNGSLDTTLWNTPGSYSIGSSLLVLNTTGNSLSTKTQTFGDNIEFVGLKSITDTNASSVAAFGFADPYYLLITNHYYGFNGNTVVRMYNGSSSDTSFGQRYTGTTMRRVRVGRYGGGSWRASVDANVVTGSSMNTTACKFQADSVYEQGANPGIDWCFAKKFQATEPSYNSSGSITPVAVPPTVTTQAVDAIATYSAQGNGNITALGTSTPDLRGFVWDTASHGDPGDVAPASSDYGDYVSASGSFSTGAFTGAIDSLAPETTYYVRAWAHNDEGYSYGGEVSFVSLAIPYAISGLVKLSGVGVEGAVVRCVRQSDNVALVEQTTDADGAYIFEDLEDDLYHVAVEYVADDQRYNALSLWDIVPYEVT